MSLLKRIVNPSILFLANKCPTSYKNNVDVILAFSVKKTDIPAPPKRPLTAYMIFCKEKRPSVLKENPSLKSTEQIKTLAAKWSQLTLDMREPYEISARENTLAYGEAHKKFYEKLTEAQKDELAKVQAEKKESRRLLRLKRVLQESGLPKPAAPAYALFVQSRSKDKQSIKATDFIKAIAEEWKNLPEMSKKPFKEKAQAERDRYVSDMEAWKAKLVKKGEKELLNAYYSLKERRPSKKS